MTPQDPGILLLIPIALLIMVLVAWPLEETETGRAIMDRLYRWIVR